MKKLIVFMWSCMLVALSVSGCGGGGGEDGNANGANNVATVPAAPPAKEESSAKAVVAFALGGVSAKITGQQVQATVPYGTNVRRLVPTFETTGARLSVDGTTQVSGVTAHDFSMPVNYLVTADDGSTAAYVVTVAVAPSQAKAITAFSIGATAAAITNGKIAVTLPYGADPKALVVTFATNGESVAVNGMAQRSGASAQDFSAPVTYVVTAADGSTASYVATVSVAPNQAKALTAFSIAGVAATVDGRNLAVTLPYGMSPADQVATFTTTGASVRVDGEEQASGRTSRDFSRPVNYVVTAADGSTASYAVSVSVAPNQAKALTAFSLGGVAATISGRDIALTLPAGADPTSQIAAFTTTGASVWVGGANQVSGSTAQDFSQPVTYVVRAADGSTASYTVRVAVAKSSAKAMTSFFLYGEPASFQEISPDNYRINAIIYSGAGTSTTLALPKAVYDHPTFTITGKSITLDGVPQVSGVSRINLCPLMVCDTSPTPIGQSPAAAAPPLVYVVTAEDGSVATYTLSIARIQLLTPRAAPSTN